MKKFDRGGDVYGTIDVFGQSPGAGSFGGNIFGGYSGSPSGWSVPTAGAGRPMTEEEADALARKFYESWDPYGGQSLADREAELNALLAEQGYSEGANSPYGELPVFLTDLIGEYPTIGGNILPSDQGTAVETTVPPVDDTDAQIRAWFEANPNATAQDVFNVMQANNVDPEEVIRAMDLDPESAIATYNEFLQASPAVTPPVEEPPAVEPSNPISGAAGAVKDIIGQVLDWFEGAPGSVVLNPGTGQVSSVWTYDPSVFGPTQPFIPVGGIPGTQTTAGVTTGNPAIDKVISGILDRMKGTGATPAEVPDIIAAVIAQQTGLPSDVVDTVVRGAEDLKKVVDDTTTKLGVDTTNPDEDDEVQPPVLPEVDMGDDFLVGGDRTPVVKGEYGQEEEPPVMPGVPGNPDFNAPPPGAGPVVPPWEQGNPDPEPPVVTNPPPTGEDADIGGILSLLQQYNTQFPMERVREDPGDLVDIDYFYDVGGDSIFAPAQVDDSEEQQAAPVFPFAQGGIVNEDMVEYLIELLRR